jgi:hypothetical protein
MPVVSAGLRAYQWTFVWPLGHGVAHAGSRLTVDNHRGAVAVCAVGMEVGAT